MHFKVSTFLENVNTIINNNFHDVHFSIEELAKQLFFSYPHTYRKIKEETGVSPSIYIRQQRLEKACSLLSETKLSMSEVARRVGFNTQHYFSKCFSEVYGCPPLRFRKQVKST